jgi:hypothetical protein
MIFYMLWTVQGSIKPKDEYFPMHISVSTIYSLQERELNPRNYPNQEFIMEFFVWTTYNDMDIDAKIQSISKYRYL